MIYALRKVLTMGILLEGNKVAKTLRNDIAQKIEHNKAQGFRAPCLAVILVGEDPASQTYVSSKQKQAESVGMESKIIRFPKEIDLGTILETVNNLNVDDNIDGILVQLPLPDHINENRVIESIDPRKDVDGLTLENVGKLTLGYDGLVPCTPKGIISLVDAYNINLIGKKVLVIGRSRLVGKPLALLLMARNATVTIAHSKTENLQEEISNHDIIIVAIGKKESIKSDWLNPKHVVIDVGIHRESDGTIKGDVEASAYSKVAYASPVPKGVGPMTIVSLLENTLIAYNKGVTRE